MHKSIIFLVFAGALAAFSAGCRMAPVEELHNNNIELFRKNIAPLTPLLEKNGVQDVLYASTITTQSGQAVAMTAPVRLAKSQSLESFLTDGGIFGVFWLSSEAADTKPGKKIPPGAYALRFRPESLDPANVEFLSADGAVLLTRPAVLKFESGEGNLIDKAKLLLRKLFGDNGEGFEIQLVDIEIIPGQPSEIRGSILFWSFRLFEDP